MRNVVTQHNLFCVCIFDPHTIVRFLYQPRYTWFALYISFYVIFFYENEAEAKAFEHYQLNTRVRLFDSLISITIDYRLALVTKRMLLKIN